MVAQSARLRCIDSSIIGRIPFTDPLRRAGWRSPNSVLAVFTDPGALGSRWPVCGIASLNRHRWSGFGHVLNFIRGRPGAAGTAATRRPAGGWLVGDFLCPLQLMSVPAERPAGFSQGRRPWPEAREPSGSATCWLAGAGAWRTGSPTVWRRPTGEQTERGGSVKHKAGSGLIKNQPKGDPADWAPLGPGASSRPKKS